MIEVTNKQLGGERPLYRLTDLRLNNVTIEDGESAIKHCNDISAADCRFEGKYVFWESNGIECCRCFFAQNARASLWYSRNIRLRNCLIDAMKTFRKAENIALEDVKITNGHETFWDCTNIKLNKVEINQADYLFMRSKDIEIDNLIQNGNYSFQYAQNVIIRNSVINSKDAFWESEHCTLYDCRLNGEYLGWYAKDLHLIRCHISGTQPLCYCQNLILEDCTFSDDANLAFEYSTIEATIKGHIASIKNPTCGHIRVENIGEIIIDQYQKQPANCIIEYDRIC